MKYLDQEKICVFEIIENLMLLFEAGKLEPKKMYNCLHKFERYVKKVHTFYNYINNLFNNLHNNLTIHYK